MIDGKNPHASTGLLGIRVGRAEMWASFEAQGGGYAREN